MATSSIFENIIITDPKEAEAFVRAIESSMEAQKLDDRPRTEGRMATREDIIRLQKIKEQRRTEHLNELHR